MRRILSLPFYALIAGVILASGCVVAPANDRGYQRHYSGAEYRQHQRHEAYRHCREAGERDCDDLLRHN